MLGYRVARGDDDCLNNANLIDWLKEQKIDVLKLELKDSSASLYSQLDQLGFPYYTLGMLLEYKSIFRARKSPEYLNSALTISEYKGEDPEMFKALVAAIFKDSPASYYHNPGLEGKVSQQQQLDCFAAYLAGLNQGYQPHLYTHLLKLDGKVAGFMCSYKKGDGGGATYGGVLKEYENRGLYLDAVRFIQHFGAQIGQKWGTAQVQLQNTVVQKTFQKAGLRPNGYSLNVHINCFFGELA